MKKIILILLLLIMFPNSVKAEAIEDVDYKVEAAYVRADIDVVGSMHVREAYVVKGALNGYRRNIKYKNSSFADWEEGNVNFSESSFYNARGISLSKVSAKKIKESDIGWTLLGSDYEKFVEKSNAIKGESGVYYKNTHEEGENVSIYNVNSSGYMVYYFDYYVNQVVVLHNDIGELYYTFFNLDTDDVKEVNIEITTPFSGTNEKYRFWAHAKGSLNGTISGITDKKNEQGKDLFKGVLLKLENYQKGEMIDVRMTFDKGIYSSLENVLNNSKMDAFDKILEVENVRAEEANSKRRIIKVFYYGSYVLGGLYILGLIPLWIFIYRKYDKEYKVGFDAKYYREFTGDYDVEVVDYLMNKSITTNALNASIMNLIYKKNISFQENDIKGSKEKNITLKLVSRDNVSNTENLLLDLLFNTIGKDNQVTLAEITLYSSNYTTAEEFMRQYNAWKMSAEIDAGRENFFENHTNIKVAASMYSLMGLMIIGIFYIAGIQNIIMSAVILIGAIAFLIYVLSFKKWSVKGREHYLKWSAFKNFLSDFGSLKDKEIPEIVLWDKYLVYATVFGIAKEVQKAMKVKLSELGMNDAMVGGYFYRDYYMFDSLSRCMSNAHSKSVSVINAHNASSSMSSGGGFGGGFSGGGGHAGGGGGGGGF